MRMTLLLLPLFLAGCKKPADPAAVADESTPKAASRVTAPARPLTDEPSRKAQARRDCEAISRAVTAYMQNPANPGNDPPGGLQDLLEPPFGGRGFLKNGQGDLIDPWGQPYQLRVGKLADGKPAYIVYTRSRADGGPVSQYGVGPESGIE